MKRFALCSLLSALSLASCTWTKADFQRLGTKVLDAAVSSAADESRAIQIEKNSGK